jgi:hypothetical protein
MDEAAPRSSDEPPLTVHIAYNRIEFGRAVYVRLGSPAKVVVAYDPATGEIRITHSLTNPAAVTVKQALKAPTIHAATLTALLKRHGHRSIPPQNYLAHFEETTLVLSPPPPRRWRTDRE